MTMTNPVDALVLDLLEWVGAGERPYAEVMEAWRTSCPRLPVWEEANARGYLRQRHESGVGAFVSVSPAGTEWLAHRRGHASTAAVVIRAPQPSEHASIRRLLAANGWSHRLGDEAWFDALLARSQGLVAVQAGEVVGFVRAIGDGISNGYLSMLVVAETHRHRGIGSRLVGEVMGSDTAITWVLRASRPGARAFFEKLGFQASADAMESTRGSQDSD